MLTMRLDVEDHRRLGQCGEVRHEAQECRRARFEQDSHGRVGL